jgi:ribosomal protein S18 acetylase RimI-like enzyme
MGFGMTGLFPLWYSDSKGGGIMTIREITEGKERHWDLLLLADPDRNMVLRYLDGGRMFLVEDAGETVAEAVLWDLDQGNCEIKNLAVREDRQGEGLGSLLVERLFSLCAGEYHTMYVGTSEAGVAFYQRLGFTVSHRKKGFFVEHYPEPIWENGRRCVDMIYLKRCLGVRGDQREGR